MGKNPLARITGRAGFCFFAKGRQGFERLYPGSPRSFCFDHRKVKSVSIVPGAPPKAVEGDPPKTRLVVQVWDNEQKLLAWRNSAEYGKAREIGDKLAQFTLFIVPGAPQ
jgi:hypothetical protein